MIMPDMSILDVPPIMIVFGLAWIILPSLAERIGKIAEQVTQSRSTVAEGPYAIAKTALENAAEERKSRDASDAAMRRSIEDLRDEMRKGFKALRDDIIRELTNRKDTP